jgi:hypothetical protein
MVRKQGPDASLSIETLRDAVGVDQFDAWIRNQDSMLPHEISTRLWYDGEEGFAERLKVAVEVYRLLPSYGQLMYWRYSEFDESTKAAMWKAYRDLLDDPSEAIAKDVVYSLWVDYFEDAETVERAWHEVSGPQEPRRPRLDRVIRASGPVPWHLKAPLYEALAIEGGWDESLIRGLYGSCIDLYGHLDRLPALRVLRQLRSPSPDGRVSILEKALNDPDLPEGIGWGRRDYLRRTNA